MTLPDETPASPDSHTLITSSCALRAFCDRLAGHSFITLDTEFIRERTYYPELCLVQVGSEDEIACIDTRADLDLSPLWEVMANRKILKILHAARQDNEIFLNVAGFVPGPVFDTQIAAALAGIGEQLGYAGLIDALLGQHIDKSQSRTDWSRRPLSDAQLQYAADDVRFLIEAYHQLVDRLTELGRLDWSREDSARLEDEALYVVDPEHAWQRVRGAKRLRGAELARIRALGAWREREAVNRNRPRRWIIKDDALVDIARRAPADRADLEAIDSAPDAVIRRYADTLLSLVTENGPDTTPAAPEIDPRDPVRLKRISRLIELTGQCATKLDVPRSMLASRSDLEALADGERDLQLLDGWRLDLIGTPLLEALREM